MELSHQFTVPVPVDVAWDHFQDIASVAECFPGASVTSVEDNTFAGSVKVKLGPIALVYNGTGTFTEKDEAARRFVVDAKGKDKRGNGTAGATVTLAMTASGDSTDVSVDTDLAITGKPAQFGRGVMQDVSDKLLGQFVACLEQRLTATGEAATAAAAAAEPVAAAPDPTPADGAGSTAELPTTPAEPVADPVETPAPAAPKHAAAAPAPAAARPTPASPPKDDALDLGATVLPILLKSYWKQAVGAVVVIGVIVWLVSR
jgi:carbon monoxide dehydrogenase subunit G